MNKNFKLLTSSFIILLTLVTPQLIHSSEYLDLPSYPPNHIPANMPMTDTEHIEYLRSEIPKAEDHILISSWGINPDKISSCGIEDLLVKAIRRGVNIYAYIGGEYTPKLEAYVKRISTHYSFIPVHAKIFAVDRDFVALGSFNWLNPFGVRPIEGSPNENGSFRCSGYSLYN